MNLSLWLDLALVEKEDVLNLVGEYVVGCWM